MNRYFDLHVHPSFKSYLSHPDAEHKDDCWKTYDNAINIIRSQSSLEQLLRGKVNLAVCPIYSLERPFTSNFMLDHVAPQVTMLHKGMMNFPSRSNSFDRLREEIRHLERSNNLDGKSFNILNSIRELDPDKLNLILAIEGSHGLDNFGTSILDNLGQLKQSDHRFLYLTLTHMTRFPVCTHAYAMKLIRKNDEFKPQGKGLTDLGRELVDKAYQEDDKSRRIFIDIKHMSLVSRRDFYRHRKEKGYQDIPIIASHMGLTGIGSRGPQLREYINKQINQSDGLIQVTFKRPRGIGRGGWFLRKNRTWFNPWSLNLYDDEIPVILDSGGLIGISLDQRILGAQKVKGEFFDEQEFYQLIGAKDADDLLKDFKTDGILVEEKEPEGKKTGLRTNRRFHLRHFCNHVLHLASQGGREEAWKHICIGSDFDGLINPVNNCVTTEEYPRLENDLTDMLEKMIKEAKKADRKAEFYESDIRQHVRDIMYGNARAFLEKHFV